MIARVSGRTPKRRKVREIVFNSNDPEGPFSVVIQQPGPGGRRFAKIVEITADDLRNALAKLK